jgi:hypothetical protein
VSGAGIGIEPAPLRGLPAAEKTAVHPPIGQHSGDGACGYIVRTYDKELGPNNQRLYLNGARVAQMSETLPIDLNSAPLGMGRHVSDIAEPFNGRIDEFRISHVQRSDGWIGTT